jgi:hypothetical protein
MGRILVIVAALAVVALIGISVPFATSSIVGPAGSFTINSPGTAGGAPRPVDVGGTAGNSGGSILTVSPVSNTFIAGRTLPQGITVCLLAAPLASPSAGVPNTYLDVSIGPGLDSGVSSIIRHTSPGGQAQSGTSFAASTPASGCISFTVQATSDGDDDITIRVLTSRFWVPGTSAFSWGWSSFAEVKKSYETDNQ